MDEIDWDESDAIWDSLPGADKVWRIYEFWPSMHDSVPFEAIYAQTEHRFELQIRYGGRPRGAESPEEWVYTRIHLAWIGTRKVDFSYNPAGIFSMWFSRPDRLVTRFDFIDESDNGIIVSDSAEVVEVERMASKEWRHWPNQRMVIG